MPDVRELIGLLSRFGVVGLLNTATCLAVIMAVEEGLGLNLQLANACGFAVGICVSFVLSRRFVFRSTASARSTVPRYLATVLAGFCLNQLVLAEAHAILGPGALNHLAAQLCGMASYTASVFLACRYWVFRAPVDPVIATV